MINFLKSLFFLITGPGMVTVVFPYLYFGDEYEVNRGDFGFFGAFLLVVGLVMLIQCFYDFAFHGQGTPAPYDPPKRVVERKLYEYVRNPIYIAVVLIMLGQGVFFGSLSLVFYACFWWVVFHLFIVFYEEPKLKKKFGNVYEAYRKSVPRWIPRMRIR